MLKEALECHVDSMVACFMRLHNPVAVVTMGKRLRFAQSEAYF